MLHAGDLGWDGGHEHGGRVHGPAPGHVAAGPVDGPADTPDDEAVALVEVVGVRDLGLVVVADGVAGRFEGGAQGGVDAFEGGGPLVSRDREVVEVDAVEALGVLTHGGVAAVRTASRIAATAATGSSPPGSGRGSRSRRAAPVRPRRSSRVSTPQRYWDPRSIPASVLAAEAVDC